MARSYEFAIIRFVPDEARDERLNVGTVIFQDDGLDVRISRRLEKTRALSAALDVDLLRELLSNFADLDRRMLDAGNLGASDRLKILSNLGPIGLSPIGTFTVDDQFKYEDQVSSIVRSFVDPEPALPRSKRKSSRLLTQIKSEFRRERVMAKRDENLDSHRIVSEYQLDQGLIADLVLRNGAMHVVETFDAPAEETSVRRAVADIAVSALVLEQARMKFGEQKTKSKLVYNASPAIEQIAKPSLDAAEHQGAELINWASANQRNGFIHSLASLATPSETKTRRKAVRFVGGAGFGF